MPARGLQPQQQRLTRAFLCLLAELNNPPRHNMNTDKVPSEYSISPTSGVRSSSGLSPVSNTLVMAKLLLSGSVALRTLERGKRIKAATLHLIQTWIIFVAITHEVRSKSHTFAKYLVHTQKYVKMQCTVLVH